MKKFNLKYASDIVRKKMDLYSVAADLFKKGKSFPQVAEILNKTENDNQLVQYVTEKAMTDEWDKIETQSKQMLDDGVPLVDIKKSLIGNFGDADIVDFVCEQWYKFKISEVDLGNNSDYLLGKSFKQIAYGSILFILVYQLSTKWYILLFPGIFIGLGLYGIIISIYAKLVSKLIHRINNEPNK